MLGHIFGQPVMMQLGSFQFGISTAAYQELSRSTDWRWASQNRYLNEPVFQYVGKGEDAINLPGVIYPEYRGGFEQINDMREAAEKGEPLNLTAGDGSALGRWIILHIDEKQTTFADQGKPRKLEFTIQLKRYDDGDKTQAELTEEAQKSLGESVAAGDVAAVSVTTPANAKGAVEKVSGLAKSVKSAVKTISGTLQNAANQLREHVAPYAEVAKDAIGGVTRAVETAGELQAEANRTLNVLGVTPMNSVALARAQTLTTTAQRGLQNCNSAVSVLDKASARLNQLSDVPVQADLAIRRASHSVSNLATACRNTISESNKIKKEEAQA